MKKRCTKCRKNKKLENFGKGARYKDGLRSWCKACVAAYALNRKRVDSSIRERSNLANKRWRQNNPESYRKKWMNQNLKKYGLTLEKYNQILRHQDGVCAICRQPETAKHHNGTTRKLAVDHCHRTNIVRGLLCSKCNPGIGYFQDDLGFLRNAIVYLSKESSWPG